MYMYRDLYIIVKSATQLQHFIFQELYMCIYVHNESWRLPLTDKSQLKH